MVKLTVKYGRPSIITPLKIIIRIIGFFNMLPTSKPLLTSKNSSFPRGLISRGYGRDLSAEGRVESVNGGSLRGLWRDTNGWEPLSGTAMRSCGCARPGKAVSKGDERRRR